jgi:16S rRNA (guanine966-N2)-methyltransferase
MRVIAGSARGRRLKSPTDQGTRPIVDRVKTALFDVLGDRVTDARVLDLFGGVGSVGIEALSRGARQATFVEIAPAIADILADNLLATHLADRAEIVRGDAFVFLQRVAGQRTYDIIYIAPPQYHGLAAKAARQLDDAPLTKAGGLVVVQIHPDERSDFARWLPRHLRLTDERRYGNTLLLFFTHGAPAPAQADVPLLPEEYA